jgi:hypothetical protein
MKEFLDLYVYGRIDALANSFVVQRLADIKSFEID